MKEKINSNDAPKALGPYSQGVKVGNLLFVSGQLPIDPLSGKLIEGDMKALTCQIIKNIEAILKNANCTLDSVIRTDVFLTDLKLFAVMNEEYAKFFSGLCPPARQTVQVAALPLNAPIEISCIALCS